MPLRRTPRVTGRGSLGKMILPPFLMCFVMLMAVFILVGFPPPSCRTWFPGKGIYLQIRVCSFDSSTGAVEIPTAMCPASARRGVCTAVGHSGFSVALPPCSGTSTWELFSLRFLEVRLRRKQADLLLERKQRAMFPCRSLVLLLPRPTSCCRLSRNARPLIHSPPPANKSQEKSKKMFCLIML